MLNHSYHNLQDVLILNSLKNIINVSTRGRALSDPVKVPDDLTVYDSGTIANPVIISDHSATYLTVPHNYSVSCAHSRRAGCIKKQAFKRAILLLVLTRLFCFGSLVILDAVCRYLSLFLLYILI